MAPQYLQGVRVPSNLITQMTKANRYLRTGSRARAPTNPRSDLIKVAWHETGHAVAWALNGGKLARTTIIAEGQKGVVISGLCTYDVGNDWPKKDRLRSALAAMGAAAICELADDPDPFGTMGDFEAAAAILRPLYKTRAGRRDRLVRTWIEVLDFFGTPHVWRTANAFARVLIARGTIEGFPPECVSADHSPVPGLAEALAKSHGSRDTWREHDWLADYVEE